MSILLPVMTDRDYLTALNTAMRRFAELCKQQDEIEVELQKLRQFIHATENMLSDDDRAEHFTKISEAMTRAERKDVGLTEAIRRILQNSYEWLTVAQVRDSLILSSFDFSQYRANPLASISTTLKRMKPEEVENIEIEGTTAYRWKGSRPVPLKELLSIPRGVPGTEKK